VTSPRIPSPCIRICILEPMTGLCIGCGRSMQEIGAWGSMAPQRRKDIMRALSARLVRLKTEHPEAYLD